MRREIFPPLFLENEKNMLDTIKEIFNTLFSAYNGTALFRVGCWIWNILIGYAWDMLQTDPRELADQALWNEAYRIFQLMQILGASLVNIFFLINFFKETSDIKHSMTLESSIQSFIKLVIVDAIFLNLSNLLIKIVEIEQDLLGIVAPAGADSIKLKIDSLDDWEFKIEKAILGNIFGLFFLIICIGGAIIVLWTVYRVFLKIFFYLAVAPLALSTYAGPQGISHSGSSWVRTFLCAIFELAGMILMLRLGTILINAAGLFPNALKGCVLSFGNRDGKYVQSLTRYFDGTTASSTDKEIIERAYDAMIARRPSISRWSYEKADCLAQLAGTLDIYAPSENGAGGIDWSWKKSNQTSASGNAAVQAALNAVGSGYSQTRRDDPGWYDCSSLVYRSYAAAGITYLNGKCAAEQAQYLVSHNMTVSYSELQPGDLIFYSYEVNGRYRNISHVAIYVGDGVMVHAANESRGVVKQALSQSNLSPQLYCRPQ